MVLEQNWYCEPGVDIHAYSLSSWAGWGKRVTGICVFAINLGNIATPHLRESAFVKLLYITV